jgi:hypothetical protein
MLSAKSYVPESQEESPPPPKCICVVNCHIIRSLYTYLMKEMITSVYKMTGIQTESSRGVV